MAYVAQIHDNVFSKIDPELTKKRCYLTIDVRKLVTLISLYSLFHRVVLAIAKEYTSKVDVEIVKVRWIRCRPIKLLASVKNIGTGAHIYYNVLIYEWKFGGYVNVRKKHKKMAVGRPVKIKNWKEKQSHFAYRYLCVFDSLMKI